MKATWSAIHYKLSCFINLSHIVLNVGHVLETRVHYIENWNTLSNGEVEPIKVNNIFLLLLLSKFFLVFLLFYFILNLLLSLLTHIWVRFFLNALFSIFFLDPFFLFLNFLFFLFVLSLSHSDSTIHRTGHAK